MSNASLLCLLITAFAADGCQSSQKELARVPQMSCFAPESGAVAYGAIDVDSGETGDASGVQFSFVVRGDSLRGFVVDARGEIPPAVPLKDVRFDPATDTVSFWYGDQTRHHFRYHVTCQELAGLARRFVTDRDTGMVRRDTVVRASVVTRP